MHHRKATIMQFHGFILRCVGILALCGALGLSCSCDRGVLGSARDTGQKNQVPAGKATPAARQSPTPIPVFSPPNLKPAVHADASFKPCNPYYPLIPGSVAEYVVKNSGRLTANMEVVVNAGEEKGKKVFTEISEQVEIDRGQKQTTTRKYICDRGKIEVISDVIEAMVRVVEQRAGSARLESKFPSTAIVMDAPSSLKRGDSWSYSQVGTIIETKRAPMPQPAFQVTFEVKDTQDVTVPAGTFKTIHIASTLKGHHIDQYFAPGIGMVKRVTDTGVSWELAQFSGLKALP